MPGQEEGDVEMAQLARRPHKPPQARHPRGSRGPTLTRLGVGVLIVAGTLLWLRLPGRGGGGAAAGAAGGGGGAAKRRAVAEEEAGAGPELLTYRIVRELPHDPEAFTQGLQYDVACAADGSNCTDIFWESTGLNGQSTVREVDLETGRVLRSSSLPHEDFGEGVTKHGDRLYQVTWRSPRTWSYAASNFSDAQLVQTPLKDGWGITSDGQHLIVSDSSETLHFIHPGTMLEERSVRVTDGGAAVRWVNELEWVEGQILGNVWLTECIARIDPQTGEVTAWITFKGLRNQMLSSLQQGGRGRQPDVLNGIAWDEKGRRLFVTGKLWPRLYQVELVPLQTANRGATLRTLRQECIPKDTSLLG